jgi:hypothetical protein
MDETRKPKKGLVPDEDEPAPDYNTAGIPGQKSTHRLFFRDLARARDLIETFVQGDMAARKRDPLEIQGLWKPNIASLYTYSVWIETSTDVIQVVANCYRGHSQGVGQHADRLTYIGPKPTIASLTLGAKRIFRIRKIQQGESSPARFYDVKLPHNSLLIMRPPMQVRRALRIHSIEPHPPNRKNTNTRFQNVNPQV